LAREQTFEWLLAWRYLWERRLPGRRLLVIAAVCLVLALACHLVALRWGRPVLDELDLGRPVLGRMMERAALVLAILGVKAACLWLLLRRFSIFSAVSIVGVYLGSAALVIVLSVMSGFENDLRSKILGTNAHAVIRVPGRPMREFREILQEARKTPGVLAAQPLVEGEVMIIAPNNQQVVVIKGIDPDVAARVTELPRYLKGECAAGKLEYLAHPEELARVDPMADPFPPAKAPSVLVLPPVSPRPTLPGLLIGCELAKNLRLFVGDDIRIASPRGGLGPLGPMPRTKSFRLAGIYYSGMYEFDTKVAYAAVEPTQRLLGLDDAVDGIELRVHDPERIDDVTTVLSARIGSAYEIKDWREQNRSLFQALKLERVAMFVVLTFIIMVASFSIVTNLMMVVVQKGRDIAILKAMGATGASLLRVFVIQGLYIGVIGTALGLLVGVGVCLALAHFGLRLDPEVYYIATLPVRLEGAEVALVTVASIAMAVIATVYPSLLAARFEPAEGLRRQ
jgi:lipoprotein-releasing system permease protein